MKILYLPVFLLIVAFDASASNYYVNAKKGHPRYNGLSPDRAKKTIQEAADLTKPGDTVFVMNGTYKNDCATCNVVDVPRSGTARNYIVYTNYPGHQPRLSFNGWAGFSLKNGVSYVKIQGFEVVGNNEKVSLNKALKQPKCCRNKSGEYDPRFNGNGIAINGTDGKHPHHIIISQNTVHDCGGGGIGASQADYITIEGNTVYNTSWYSLFGTSGISFYQFWNFDNGKGYRNIIRGNKCYNNRSYVPWIGLCKITDGNGIIVDDFRNQQNGSKLGVYNGRTLIENNVSWYNGGTGIHTFQTDHVDIVNNTAYCNSQSPELDAGQIIAGVSGDIKIINNIMVSDRSKIVNSNYQNKALVYHNNLHYNVSNPDKIKVYISGETSMNLNPDFINPQNSIKADFRLKRTSPAINCGNRSTFSQTDIMGIKRPSGDSPDMGAYEYINP